MTTINQKKISFYTLGCRLNQSETATIENTFQKKDYTIVDFDSPADIVVINTCTVTENGDAETRRLVQKVNRLNPQARIALIGCQAQVQKEKLAQLPNVRWVVGNGRKMDLADILKTHDAETTHVITPTIERTSFTLPAAAIDSHHKRANLKIQDGCDFFCSFCEIPFARGRARSRVFDDILKEANILAQAGHKEMVLTGINVGTYEYEGKNILDVIRALEKIDLIQRIRISSIEPTTIPRELIFHMAQSEKLCRYLHIPLQSGSNFVLEKMKRLYAVEEFNSFINFALETVPEICLGTDVIVGFPDETEEEFEKTYQYLRDSALHYFHIFSYSDRDHAQSRKLDHKISPQMIQARSKMLRELSTRKRNLYHSSFRGKTVDVLFEHERNGHWNGVTDNFIRVMAKSEERLTNRILTVKLETVDDDCMIGALI